MNVLLLAPQPFYTERGTPIAVNLLLRALSERGDHVDLLTYHIGTDVIHPNVRISRINKPLFVDRVSPGFSLKKILCDLAMAPKAAALMQAQRYDVIHAVEESVFLAMRLSRKFNVPYIYDMDSSMAQQMIDKTPLFALVGPILRGSERAAIRRACAVVPMCDAMADMAKQSGAARVITLRDISLLDVIPQNQPFDPKREFGIKGLCMVYLGNLESYQGIDLLLRGFALLDRETQTADLVIIGGSPQHVSHYRRKTDRMGIGNRVHFAGPKPLSAMRSIFASADILVSPRIKGNNTPMKIYSYMDSGKPILATRLPTHTQVLDIESAILAEPKPAPFAAAMKNLITDSNLRRRLSARAKATAEQRHSYAAFKKTVNALYDGLATEKSKT
jgi:glycosyltransferase involved in cell wall biosynthesis